MALPSGVYIFENVQNRNWAILNNDNDGDDVISGTDADTKAGHKWEVRKLHNGTYLFRNQEFNNHASYKLLDVDHPTVISIRTGAPNRWRINRTDNLYWVSDLDGARCWTLKYDRHETPITLEEYTHSNYQHWKIVPENEVHNPHVQAPRSSAKPKRDLRRCPPPTPAFTGRQGVLSKMHEYFSRDVGKRHVFVLHGLGGIGKSQITLKFIEESQVCEKPRFSDVFFIDATSAETIKDDLRNIALAKGSGDSTEDGLQWLSKQNVEWLLFFDNADDTELNLLDYFPLCFNGNIIITTRNIEARIHAPLSNLKISGLTPDDAKKLLFKMAGLSDPCERTILLARSIVKELGHLALAVVQAGAYISKSGCGLVHYLEMYRERRTEFLEKYLDQVQKIDDYEWTVYTTWTVNFEKLSLRAAMFLNICAFFHHDGISAGIFQKAAANIETRTLGALKGLEIAKDFIASFRSAEGLWDLHKFLAVVMEIRSYSLIDFDEVNEVYSIHPLVHAWTRSRICDPATIHEGSQIILSLSIDKTDGAKDIAYRRSLLPHIDVSLRSGTARDLDPDVAAWLWRPYYESGRWKEAEKLQELVVETRKRIFGEEHPVTLEITADLASTYRSQGRWKEAEELDVLVAETRKRILGEEHPDTLTSLSNLASTYSSQGWQKEAEGVIARVTEIRKRVPGDGHLDTLTSMCNLVWTCSSQGRWKEAEELNVQAIKTRRRTLGEEHPDTLTSLSNLASTYWSQGRQKEAEELDVRVAEMRKRVLGEKHPDTLVSMSNLASTYASQDRREEAERLQVRVVELRKEIFGDEHPDTLTSMSNLAFTYCRQGRWKEAEELEVRVIEARKRTLGEEHPDTLVAMSNLVWTYSSQGRWDETEALLVRVVQMSKKVLGDNHPDTLERVARLASIVGRSIYASNLG